MDGGNLEPADNRSYSPSTEIQTLLSGREIEEVLLATPQAVQLLVRLTSELMAQDVSLCSEQGSGPESPASLRLAVKEMTDEAHRLFCRIESNWRSMAVSSKLIRDTCVEIQQKIIPSESGMDIEPTEGKSLSQTLTGDRHELQTAAIENDQLFLRIETSIGRVIELSLKAKGEHEKKKADAWSQIVGAGKALLNAGLEGYGQHKMLAANERKLEERRKETMFKRLQRFMGPRDPVMTAEQEESIRLKLLKSKDRLIENGMVLLSSGLEYVDLINVIETSRKVIKIIGQTKEQWNKIVTLTGHVAVKTDFISEQLLAPVADSCRDLQTSSPEERKFILENSVLEQLVEIMDVCDFLHKFSGCSYNISCYHVIPTLWKLKELQGMSAVEIREGLQRLMDSMKETDERVKALVDSMK